MQKSVVNFEVKNICFFFFSSEPTKSVQVKKSDNRMIIASFVIGGLLVLALIILCTLCILLKIHKEKKSHTLPFKDIKPINIKSAEGNYRPIRLRGFSSGGSGGSFMPLLKPGSIKSASDTTSGYGGEMDGKYHAPDQSSNPAGIYLLKVNYRNTRTRRRSSVFIVDFEYIPHLVFLFLTLNM